MQDEYHKEWLRVEDVHDELSKKLLEIQNSPIGVTVFVANELLAKMRVNTVDVQVLMERLTDWLDTCGGKGTVMEYEYRRDMLVDVARVYVHVYRAKRTLKLYIQKTYPNNTAGLLMSP